MTNASKILQLGGEGVLLEADLLDFSEAKRRIIQLMSNGEWWSATSIITASGQREGLRRLRDLRSDGFEVYRMRGGLDTREWWYRLSVAPAPELVAVQPDLF